MAFAAANLADYAKDLLTICAQLFDQNIPMRIALGH